MAGSRRRTPRTMQRRYADACMYIDLIKGDKPERLPGLERVLQAAQRELIELWVSPIVMVELRKYGQGSSEPEVIEGRERLRKFFDAPYFRQTDIPIRTGVLARELIWKYQGSISLKPVDALHIACAMELGCDYLDTADDKVLRVLAAEASEGGKLRAVAYGENLPELAEEAKKGTKGDELQITFDDVTPYADEVPGPRLVRDDDDAAGAPTRFWRSSKRSE